MSISSSPAVGGGLDAFVERAYRDHGAAVFSLARGLCGPTLAAEVTQDVFVRLWTDPGGFDPDRGSLRTFLLTSSRGRSIDLLRSTTARRRRKEITHRRDSSRKGPDVDDVADAAIADVQRSRILAALARLPVGEREAILATVYGGYTYYEAAEVLDQPEGTVKSRIRRGMLRLRTILADHAANDRDEVDLTRDPPTVPSSIVQGRSATARPHDGSRG